MIFTIVIAFIALIGLIVLHELGHFVVAKKFGVKVEEFGIGYPPRLIGKKIGETVYSLNLIPFGAFVRVQGEEKPVDDPASYSKKPIWQRFLIVSAGVISFWIISAVLLSIVMSMGVPTVIDDMDNGNLVNPKVQIAAIAPKSPASEAKIRIGDSVVNVVVSGGETKAIARIKDLQDFVSRNKGQNITFTIERGKETLKISLIPRINPPANEGAIGVALVRTALKSYPWYQAPIEGIKATVNLTIGAVEGWGQALLRLAKKQPTGVQLMGPIGILDLFGQVSQLGISYFLQFVAVISVYVALFNALPVPMTDGGRILFLLIEKIKKGPINQKVTQSIEAFFFVGLILLSIWVAIQDIQRIF